MKRNWSTVVALFGGLLLGIALDNHGTAPHTRRKTAAGSANPEVASLKAEIQATKDRLPDQAHAMQDVANQFTNVWFAAGKRHWDLTNFYLGETRNHLRWAVRIIPKRKDNAGREVDLVSILQGDGKRPIEAIGSDNQSQRPRPVCRRVQVHHGKLLRVPQGFRQAVPAAADSDRAGRRRSSISIQMPSGRCDCLPRSGENAMSFARRRSVFVASSVLLGFAAACVASDQYRHAEYLVEAATLWQHDLQSQHVVLDARPRKDYETAHIPGAIWVDHERWAKSFSDGKDRDAWSRRIGCARD